MEEDHSESNDGLRNALVIQLIALNISGWRTYDKPIDKEGFVLQSFEDRTRAFYIHWSVNARETLGKYLLTASCNSHQDTRHMDKSLDAYNTPDPSVNSIESIKRHPRERYERIVSPRGQHQRQSIENCHVSSSVSPSVHREVQSSGPVHCDEEKDNIENNVRRQRNSHHPRWKSSHVDISKSSKLPVMAKTE